MTLHLLTLREAATRLRISERHLQTLIGRGEISVVHAGRRRLVSEDALTIFAHEHERRLNRPTPVSA